MSLRKMKGWIASNRRGKGRVALFAIALSGCEGREIAACEDYLKDGLRSPSTYNRVNVSARDEPVTAARIVELGGREPRGGQSLALRSVTIEYDAQNAFGTPIRGALQCGFVVRDGEVAGQQLMDSAVLLAKVNHQTRRLQGDPEPNYPCCL